ncbi:MAG: type III-B CRISPR module-associated protein Cmr5 [Defluviicoccus sp.]|nr:type III-B CRISPR module-associated protein Cmr5 [Defluviicoccus sp.]MDG4608959.1 type III-B CRISPR module-associated protein Cmr5 [Defluviicoccus sp.]
MDNNIQLQRAKHALDRVKKMQPGKPEVIKEYLSMARALPAEIRMNGLGQAIAMLKARSVEKAGPKKLYEHVSDWMCRKGSPSPYHGKEKPEEALLDAIVGGKESAYRQAYVEIDAYLAWLKRFADAFLEKSDDARQKEAS